MKYKDLPTMEICTKLLSVCFQDPKKDLMVAKFYNQAKPMIEFIGQEKQKFLDRYGVPDEEKAGFYNLSGENLKAYQIEMEKVLDVELEQIPPLDIVFEDFDNCFYAKEESAWMNAQEILSIVQYCDKTKPS